MRRALAYRMKALVVLDTNFLLIPAQFGVDVFAELERVLDFQHEVVMIDVARAELEALCEDKKTSATDRRAARLGLQLLKAKGIRVVSSDKGKVFKTPDKATLDFAIAGCTIQPKSVVVATQDKLLRDQLRAANVPVIVLRQRQYLELQ